MKRPEDIKFIDVHVHAFPLKEGGLEQVNTWMDDRRIDQCIISPLDHKGSRAYTPEERKLRNEVFAKFKGRIHRMCLIEPGDFETVEAAVAALEQEKKEGAIAMGEHYGKGLSFDDAKNQLIYEACEKVALPVMFHIDQNKNMVTKGMPEVDRVLKKYSKVPIIAHAYWWRHYNDGTCDRQLSDYPNLYADVSGNSIIGILARDPAKAREFVLKHQDKILFGTDEGWWSFSKPWTCATQYTFFEGLNLPDKVRYKIYRGNAIKVYGLKPDVN